MTSPKPEPMTEEKLRESAREILRLSEDNHAFCAPWVSRTFEIDCPCPNGVHCGDPHSCEEVVSPEEYPASHEEPAEMTDEDPGQCVVQISVPGLETFAKANGELIAGLRNRAPAVVRGLLELLDAERAKRVELEAEMVPYCDVCGGDGESLRTAVEVCRDCYDANGMAAELAIAKRIAEWLRAEAERCQKAMGLYTVSEVLKFADDVERGDWRR